MAQRPFPRGELWLETCSETRSLERSCYDSEVTHEAHLTIRPGAHARAALDGWMRSHATRLTTIELSNGEFPVHTMVTAWLSGDADVAIRTARALATELASLGVDVTRVKVERPETASAARCPSLYREHHVKVRTARDERDALHAVATACGAHLSRNARRVVEGAEERFFTQRFARGGASTVQGESLARLLDELRRAGVPVVKVEREHVVYDDNLALDAGWLPEVGGRVL